MLPRHTTKHGTKYHVYALDSSGVKGKEWSITKKLNDNLTASVKTQHGQTRQIDTHKRQHTPCKVEYYRSWNTLT